MRKRIVLPLSSIDSMNGFHDLVASMLEFPSYYGRNLDAFRDGITDNIEDIDIVLVGVSALPDDLKSELTAYVELLREYQEKSNGKLKLFLE